MQLCGLSDLRELGLEDTFGLQQVWPLAVPPGACGGRRGPRRGVASWDWVGKGPHFLAPAGCPAPCMPYTVQSLQSGHELRFRRGANVGPQDERVLARVLILEPRLTLPPWSRAGRMASGAVSARGVRGPLWGPGQSTPQAGGPEGSAAATRPVRHPLRLKAARVPGASKQPLPSTVQDLVEEGGAPGEVAGGLDIPLCRRPGVAKPWKGPAAFRSFPPQSPCPGPAAAQTLFWG